MAIVTIHEAKTQLSKLIARVEAGEDIVILRGKQPVARLVGSTRRLRPVVGALAGRYPPIPDALFFDPAPDEELKAWEGGGDEEPAR